MADPLDELLGLGLDKPIDKRLDKTFDPPNLEFDMYLLDGSSSESDNELKTLTINFSTEFLRIYEPVTEPLEKTEFHGNWTDKILKSIDSGPKDVARLFLAFIQPEDNQHKNDARIYHADFGWWKLFAALAREMGSNDSWKECSHLRDTHVYPILTYLFERCLVTPGSTRDVDLTLILEDIGIDGLKNRFWSILMKFVSSSKIEAYEDISVRAANLLYQIYPAEVEELAVPLMKSIFTCGGSTYNGIAALFSSVNSQCALKMMPMFLSLCQHGDERARFNCVVVFAIVACTVPLEFRRRYFVPIYCKLLEDPSIRISRSAVDGLGFFIVTLSELPFLDLNGGRHMKFASGFDDWCRNKRIGFMPKVYFGEIGPVNSNHFRYHSAFSVLEDVEDKADSFGKDDPKEFASNGNEASEELKEYNNFFFWRDPLPVLHFDIETTSRRVKKRTYSFSSEYREHLNNTPHDSAEYSSCNSGVQSNNTRECTIEFDVLPPPLPDNVEQINGIPKMLINHFLQDGNKWDVIARAYNLPAVLMCIGCENWPVLKETYDDFFIKGRPVRLMATKIATSYIHELANILGKDIAERDLVPLILKLFQGDSDAFSSAIPHLAEFFWGLSPLARRSIFPAMINHMPLEFMNNYLIKEASYLTLADYCQFVWPASLTHLKARDRSLRNEAMSTVVTIISHVAICVSRLQTLLAELAEQFAHSTNWYRRQTFALISSKLISGSVLSDEVFARDILPHLLDLSWDRIPNVRIYVAKTLTRHVILRPHFVDKNCAHRDVIFSVLKRLLTDKDRDVRFFASPLKKSNETSPPSGNANRLM